jgi:enamine deaminase RidA (YjgF/YER057c/UK114 family)
MDVEIDVAPLEAGARRGIRAVLAVDGTDQEAIERLFDAVEATLRDHGLGLADLVRTRLFASSRAARDAASKVRFARLVGPARCATSSYIDDERFPEVGGVRLDIYALEGAAADKISVEYEPKQPPCRYVATGDRVYLSGNTSVDPTFEEQIARIRPRLAESLRLAGERLGRPVRPVAVTAYVHRSVTVAELRGLAERLGLDGLTPDIGRCEGYSAPGKLIEVEVDAVAGA